MHKFFLSGDMQISVQEIFLLHVIARFSIRRMVSKICRKKCFIKR